MRRAAWLQAFGAVCAAAASPCVPAIADDHDDALTVGQRAYDELRSRGEIAESSRYLPILRRIGGRIAAAARPHWFEERFYVIRGSDINAFASPGGYVYVYEGLLRNVDNADELACVLGHETAHLVLGHLEAKSRQQRRKSSLLNLGRIFGGAAAGSANAIGAASTVANYGYLNFTRQQEYAADELGTKLAAKAGFDPWGTVWFLQELERVAGDAGYEQYVQQHPSTSDRIARIQAFLHADRARYGRWSPQPANTAGLL